MQGHFENQHGIGSWWLYSPVILKYFGLLVLFTLFLTYVLKLSYYCQKIDLLLLLGGFPEHPELLLEAS